MTLETDNEARIWSFPVDGSCPQIQSFSLTKLMYGISDHPNYLVQRGSCLVMGVKSMPKDAEEFDEIIAQMVDEGIQKYRQEHEQVEEFTNEQKQRFVRLLRQNYCAWNTTSFRAFRLVDANGRSMADGNPYQGILIDGQWLGILYFDTQEITVLPFGDAKDGLHRNLFYDARAKIAASKWGYDGSLDTALSDFQKRAFTFNLARSPSNFAERIQLARTMLDLPPERRISGIPTDTNLPLDQVLQIISQKPVG